MQKYLFEYILRIVAKSTIRQSYCIVLVNVQSICSQWKFWLGAMGPLLGATLQKIRQNLGIITKFLLRVSIFKGGGFLCPPPPGGAAYEYSIIVMYYE